MKQKTRCPCCDKLLAVCPVCGGDDATCKRCSGIGLIQLHPTCDIYVDGKRVQTGKQ